MLFSIFINYVFGYLLSIEKLERHQKAVVASAVIINLSILFYFKYFNFFIDNFNRVWGSNIKNLQIIMPIGISFFTFQAMSYVIDVYRKQVKPQKNIYNIALYVSLFPQLIVAPIVKYHDVEKQIESRTHSLELFYARVRRFVYGLSKKILITNTLAAIADDIFALNGENLTAPIAWLGAICYSLQLYYDFSGYSDMAIGLGKMFGFTFLENFNYPYISKSITKFWRRWHISLSTWFKEYVYIPLGGNRKFSTRTYINLFIVFLVTGFWHGVNWIFILWGAWNGIFIVLERLLRNKIKYKFKIIPHLYTILIFTFGWVLFRSESLTQAKFFIGAMLGQNKHVIEIYKVGYFLNNFSSIILLLACIISIPIFKIVKDRMKENIPNYLIEGVLVIFLLIVSISFLAASTYNSFIYFRF